MSDRLIGAYQRHRNRRDTRAIRRGKTEESVTHYDDDATGQDQFVHSD